MCIMYTLNVSCVSGELFIGASGGDFTSSHATLFTLEPEEGVIECPIK